MHDVVEKHTDKPTVPHEKHAEKPHTPKGRQPLQK